MATELPAGTRLTTEAPRQAGARSAWAIAAAHSLVQFAVEHLMFITVRGRFTDVRGAIRCPDEADPSPA